MSCKNKTGSNNAEIVNLFAEYFKDFYNENNVNESTIIKYYIGKYKV